VTRSHATVITYLYVFKKKKKKKGSSHAQCSMQFPYQGSRHPDGVTLSSKRVQTVFPLRVCEGKLESSRTLKSVWTCYHDVWTDATLNCPDKNMGSDFSELESAHNLS
jgi:hypothetical protein